MSDVECCRIFDGYWGLRPLCGPKIPVTGRRSSRQRHCPYGTGVLIAAAAAAGASDIWVGVGGSASTDGGRGALRAIADAGGLGRATLTVLCDVSAHYLDAARVFGPQKGADPGTVLRLEQSLTEFAEQLPPDPPATYLERVLPAVCPVRCGLLTERTSFPGSTTCSTW
jgi:glycerate kinase